MSTHPTRMELDMLLLDAGFAQRDTVRAHVDSCAQCGATFAAMRVDADDFASQRLVRSSDMVVKRLSVKRSWFPIVFIPFVVAAGAVAIWIQPSLKNYTGAKGDAVVRFAVGSRDDSLPYAIGEAHAHSGDGLAFETQGAVERWLFIVAVRTDGPVATYAPADKETSMLVHRDGVLDDAIILDDPGVERVFAIVSEGPIVLDTIEAAAAAIKAGGEQALRNTKTLPIPCLSQSSILLEVAPP